MKMLALLLTALWATPAFSFPQDPGDLIRNFADLVLSSRMPRPVELDDPALYPATREFGPTVIALSSLPIDSGLASARVKPWSSHWFPRADKDLFSDGRGGSPLEKYDQVRSTLTSRESRAAQTEKERYSPDIARWEGLCDAWAIASLIYPEPSKSRTLRLDGGYHEYKNKRLTFSVGDQKALLLKTLEAVPGDSLKIYGQKFIGDFNGWIYPDLFPQELHRFVEKQLFERKVGFVMDHDPGVEIWNEPVYKANYRIEAVNGRNDAVFVRLWLYSAAPLRKEEKDRTGAREVAREYNYFLYGRPDGNGNLVVESGVWHKGDLVDSRRDHPDFLFTIPDSAKVIRASYNGEIDPSVVDQILGW